LAVSDQAGRNSYKHFINKFSQSYIDTFCVQKRATKVHGFGLAKQRSKHLRGASPQKIAPTSWKRSWGISTTTVATKQVVVGLRSTRKFGIPQPWRPAGSRRARKSHGFPKDVTFSGLLKQMTRLLPKLYGIAEGMCLLEMSRWGNKPHSILNQVVAVTRLYEVL